MQLKIGYLFQCPPVYYVFFVHFPNPNDVTYGFGCKRTWSILGDEEMYSGLFWPILVWLV